MVKSPEPSKLLAQVTMPLVVMGPCWCWPQSSCQSMLLSLLKACCMEMFTSQQRGATGRAAVAQVIFRSGLRCSSFNRDTRRQD